MNAPFATSEMRRPVPVGEAYATVVSVQWRFHGVLPTERVCGKGQAGWRIPRAVIKHSSVQTAVAKRTNLVFVAEVKPTKITQLANHGVPQITFQRVHVTAKQNGADKLAQQHSAAREQTFTQAIASSLDGPMSGV
jgi:hypothetical protein